MSEESTVMLSALQHYLFCPRQCALIHVEGVWNENFLTASGRQLHERVDRRGGETRKDVHLATARRWIGKQLVAISLMPPDSQPARLSPYVSSPCHEKTS